MLFGTEAAKSVPGGQLLWGHIRRVAGLVQKAVGYPQSGGLYTKSGRLRNTPSSESFES
ncbi:hypothetical protein WAI453_008601 [Rhynchosporium graminicola]